MGNDVKIVNVHNFLSTSPRHIYLTKFSLFGEIFDVFGF